MKPLNKESEKEKFIFGSIFLFANKLQTIGDRFDKDITMKQWLLIICIIEAKVSSPTLTEAAELMGCSRQNVKKLALNLESKGLIDIIKDSQNPRAVNLKITEKCESFFKKREDAENIFIADLFKNLTKLDIDSLYTSFIKLFDTITEIDEKTKLIVDYKNIIK